MQSNLRDQDIFETAFAGIPRVAELIAALGLEDRATTLDAAEQHYKQMARDLGVSEGTAEVWGAAVTSLLQLRVAEETPSATGASRTDMCRGAAFSALPRVSSQPFE